VALANGALSGTPPDIQTVKNNDMYAIISPDQNVLTSSFSTTYGASAAGYSYQDEADGSSSCSGIIGSFTYLVTTTCKIGAYTKVDPALLVNMSQNLRAKDPTRPVYEGYTNAFAGGWYPGGPVSVLAAAADFIGYDMYPLVDYRNTFGGLVSPGHAWSGYNTVMSARTNAGFAKPIWPDVETSATDIDGGMNTLKYTPPGKQVAALVWNYIIGGARGITYFNHCFCSSINTSSNDDLNNPKLSDIRAAVGTANAQIKALAPVINGPFASGYVTTDQATNVSTMVKYYQSHFYIFAVPHASGSRPTVFTVKSGTSVTVLNENRTLPITNNTFTDTFADENTVHIYLVN
jgi:hypothetical protein